MSDEISYKLHCSLTNGSLVDSWSTGTVNADQTTARRWCGVMGVSTVAEEVDTGDVTALSYGFRNLDATNYVEIGVMYGSTFCPTFEIPAGGCAFLPSGASGASLYAQADTASVDLEVVAYSE